ncbi:hypothetical protein KFE25_013618 [Diacronema lutheri]|uniref:Structural maintenance of chromosomes protein n=1 Tax=Diacronema lutheri TaxID=2081491 RepID=A0A8J5XZP9_DIALT|nr:hypothetical protein KFE25_013618 [Diacronema lutheri]
MAASGRPKRLIISKMVLENFKSYAGVQEIGPFEKCFSAVVGPNGSGKSNVIDAMLFVFGKRAKQMRQAKVADLIHASEAYPELPYARVVVHFVDIYDLEGDEYEVVPGSELEVSRVAYRDSTSKYFVGGRPSNFTDVTALCKQRGVDLDHNRFLILQGEVEQIAMMKPKAPSPHEDGLLEYLEDLIGSNRHVEPINALAADVDQLTEQRGAMLNRLKAVEREKDALCGAKDEAVTFVRSEHELACKRAVLYQVYLGECAAVTADVGGKRAALEAKLAHERAKAAEVEATRGDAEARSKESAAAHAKQAKRAEKAKAEFSHFEKRDIEGRESLKSLKAQAKKAKAALDKEAKRAAELAAAAARADEDVERLTAEAETHRAAVSDAEAKVSRMYESLASEVAPLRATLDGLQAERAPHALAVSEAEAASHELEAEAELLNAKARVGAARAEKAAEAAARAAQARDAKRAAARDAAKAAGVAALADKAAAAALDAAADALSAAIERRDKALGGVEEARAAHAAARGQTAVISALLAANAAGELPGVYGRLGGLGSIGSKYDVAISTACGALEHIVVDDTDAAQRCVELLRERKLGVATFILLDKVTQRLGGSVGEPFAPPAGAARLFDLVTPVEPKFAPAFLHALGETLVCDSLEAASATAFGGSRRFRTVSLQGDVVDVSGAMSGGGGAPSKGRLCLGAGAAAGKKGGKGSAPRGDGGAGAPLVALEADATEADAAVGEARAALAACKEAKAAASKASRDAALDAKKAEAAATSAESQAADAERQSAAADGDKGASNLSADDVARLAQLEAESAGAGKALGAARAALGKVDAKIGAVQAQLDAAGGTAFKVLKAKLDGAQASLASATQGAGRAGLQAEASRAAAAKSDAAQAKLRADAERLGAQAEAVSASLRALEDEAAACLSALREAQVKEEDAAAELRTHRAELERADEIVAKVRSVEVDICGQLDEFKRLAKESEAKAKHWSAKLDSLREHVAQLGREFGAELARQAAGAADGEADDDDDGDAAARHAAAQATVAAGGAHGLHVCSIVELSDDEIADVDVRQLQCEIAAAEEAIARMAPNMAAIADYQAKEADWLARLGEFDATCARRDAARAQLDALKRARHAEFMEGFKVISSKLKEMYQMITLGGDAELDLVDSLDPFSEGVIFTVRPPRKSWKQIGHLSGGEKTLSSLALVFALHHYKPTPLYVMDEIDAALDFKNVSIVGNYIKERTRNAQFIVISLRNNMFELADRLVGIYKTDNCTKSVAINPATMASALGTPAVPAQ